MLIPVAVAGLALLLAFLALAYRAEFFTADRFDDGGSPPRYHGRLVVKTALVVTVMVVLFFLEQPVAKVAIIGGAFLLLTRRVNPAKI